MATQISDVLGELRRLREGWVSGGWSWDRRFDCVASTFDQSRASEAAGLVVSVLPNLWQSSTLKNAPTLVAEVAEATGGVRSDQLLYAAPEVDGVVAYGLWWPWGGEGSNISLRVGLTGRTSFDDMVNLREIFGAPDD